MKKIMIFMLLIVMAFSLIACGSGNSDPASNSSVTASISIPDGVNLTTYHTGSFATKDIKKYVSGELSEDDCITALTEYYIILRDTEIESEDEKTVNYAVMILIQEAGEKMEAGQDPTEQAEAIEMIIEGKIGQ